ncbi:hypothetical protein ACXYTJ_13785 [Gilvimarinus sp. F26214L]|uniref:hypothetical protein n=1 Tax=Gilvimarinus sp. DZF01 TaxID=3461371 RepID=UPI0040454D3C
MATKTAKQLCCLLLISLASTALAVERYFRYVDEHGVTVMDSRIPPQYVKNGYEVVTPAGRVLEVVPPAPTEAERAARAAQRQQEMELAEWDRYLKRRYTSVDDIDAAKDRKLADLEASLAILRANTVSIQAQIEDVQGRAANAERAGRKVPESFLESLRKLRKELKVIQDQVDQREVEKQEMGERFEREKERFAAIQRDS